jgi:biopolymer transport protein ExbD
MQIRREEEQHPEINLVPMIDCMFFLLVFFLATAAIRKKYEDVSMELPKVESAAVKRKAPDGTMILTVYLDPHDANSVMYRLKSMKDSMVTSGGRRHDLTFGALIQELRKRAGTSTEIRVDADHRVPSSVVLQLVDHLQLYHLKFGLRTADQKG